MSGTFRNDETVLRQRVEKVAAMRRELGIDALVGGLEAVLVTVEPDRLESAAQDFLATTGYRFATALSYGPDRGCVLTHPGSTDFLFRRGSGL